MQQQKVLADKRRREAVAASERMAAEKALAE
jgi:hypothetical protein